MTYFLILAFWNFPCGWPWILLFGLISALLGYWLRKLCSKKETDELKHELESERNEHNNLKGTFDRKDKDFAKLENGYTKFKARAKENEDKLSLDFQGLMGRYGTLETERNSIATAFDGFKTTSADEVRAAQLRYEAEVEARGKADKALSKIRGDYDSAKAAADKASGTIKALEGDKGKLSAENATLKQQATTTNDELAKLQAALDAANKKVAEADTTLSAEKENSKNKIAQLLKDLEARLATEKEKTRSAVTAKINDLNTRFNTEKTGLQASLDGANAKLSNLPKLQADLDAANAKLSNLPKLQADLDATNAKLVALPQLEADLEATNAKFNTEKTQLQEELLLALSFSELDREAYEIELKDVQDKLALQKGKLNEEKESSNNKIAKILNDLEAKLADQKENMKLSIGAKISNLNDKFSVEKNRLAEELGLAKEDSKAYGIEQEELKRKLAEAKDKLSEEKENANNKIAKLLKDLEAKLADEKEKTKAIVGKKISDLNTRFVTERDSLNLNLTSANKAKSDLEVELAALKARLARTKDELEDTSSNISSAEADKNAAQKEIDDLKAKLAQKETELVTEKDNAEKHLEKVLTNLKTKLAAEKEQTRTKIETRFNNINEDFASQKDRLNAEIERLKAALANSPKDLSSELKTAKSDANAFKSKADASISDLNAEIERLKAELAAAANAAAVTPKKQEPADDLERIKQKAKSIDFSRIGTGSADKKDDLKKIKGIGPYLEKKLNALGIYSFQQIANFSDEDADKINEAIEFFPGRVKRDKWVEQAKGLNGGSEAAKPKQEATDDPTLLRLQEKAKSIDFSRIGAGSADTKDDLKKIKGIGPFLEKKLNAIGIYTFQQIANFSDEDADKINDAVEFFPGRVKRDEWVKQAKAFVEKNK